MDRIEKWDLYEITVRGHSEGNPFLDYTVSGRFEGPGETIAVDGFYDGDGVYRVRFMPSHEGVYRYSIDGSALEAPVAGAFEAISPTCNNHGLVHVEDSIMLAYADGTPYYSVGTTCYAWVHQPLALQEQTLKTLSDAPFNKLRFCIFPKFYEYNTADPLTYPFERGGGEGIDPQLVELEKRTRVVYPGIPTAEMDYAFDYTRPNPEHFRRFDERILQLRDMGIEADLILMHPYDRWGINEMAQESCDAYLRYVVARYGAFRNVWWSLANEFDLIHTKSAADWEHYGCMIEKCDPYHHLCSVHNCTQLYDFSRPWITHQSVQRLDFYRHVEYTDEYLQTVGKPIVWDEICYEGNISLGWGNISGEELVRRFWEAFMRGGHAGHGETFLDRMTVDDEQPVLWWSHGGTLKGESVPRLRFLKDILAQVPGRGLRRGEGIFDEVVGCAVDAPQDHWIHYLGICQPLFRRVMLPEDADYQVEIIDTWNMNVHSAGVHRGLTTIELPGRPYMAIRIMRVKN